MRERRATILQDIDHLIDYKINVLKGLEGNEFYKALGYSIQGLNSLNKQIDKENVFLK